jgi:outer membrane beta-barrel protein
MTRAASTTPRAGTDLDVGSTGRLLGGRAASLTLGLVAALVAAPALAQDDKEDDPGAVEPVTETDVAPPAQLDPGGPPPFARVADDEETIYAVQRKAFLVNRRFEVSVMGAAAFADRFVNSVGPAASVTYHLAENFGIEAFGTFMFPDASALTEELLNELRLTPEFAKLTQMLWAGGIGFEWSPIYGKVEIMGTSLGNFNFFLNVGAGIGQSRVPCTSGRLLDPQTFGEGARCASPPENEPRAVVYEPNQLHLVTRFGGGVRFYFSNSWGLRLEITDYLFPSRVYRPENSDQSQRFTDAIRNNIYFQLGVSYIFGGED